MLGKQNEQLFYPIQSVKLSKEFMAFFLLTVRIEEEKNDHIFLDERRKTATAPRLRFSSVPRNSKINLLTFCVHFKATIDLSAVSYAYDI